MLTFGDLVAPELGALRDTTAPQALQRWRGGFFWWHTIPELLAYGLTWRQIEADVMGGIRPVRIEDIPCAGSP